MLRKRLDAQINAEHYEYIKNESDKTGIPMNVISDNLLAIGISVKSGEVIEQQSLPVIREIIQSELRKQFAQQRQEIQEDMGIEFTNEIKAILRSSDNRLAGLLVKIFRHANIAQRLIYTLLAKSHGAEYAAHVYEDASQKAGRDLASRAKENNA